MEELICFLIPDTSVEDVRSTKQELMEDDEFYSWMNEKYVEARHCRIGGGPQRETLYIIVRILQPNNFVETGVFD